MNALPPRFTPIHSRTPGFKWARGVSGALLGLIGLIGFGSPAGAALLLEEYFDLGGANADAVTGWSDGTNNVQYNASANLSFSNPSYEAGNNTGTTGAILGSGTATPRGIQRSFSVSALSGELWVSFLANITSANTTAGIIGFGLNNATYSNASPNGDMVGIGHDGVTGYAAAWRNQSNGTLSHGSDTTFALNSTYLIVAKITIDAAVAADNDSLRIWTLKPGDIFSASEAGLGTPDLDITTADFGTGVANIWVGRANTVFSWRADAIRLSNATGTTGVREVLGVPEPAVGGLLLAGLGWMVGRRARRRP
jgi:hypothetical protein